MKTISTIEKVPNSFQSHPERAMSAMAVTPNTALSTLMRKNRVGLPGLIFYFILLIADRFYVQSYYYDDYRFIIIGLKGFIIPNIIVDNNESD